MIISLKKKKKKLITKYKLVNFIIHVSASKINKNYLTIQCFSGPDPCRYREAIYPWGNRPSVVSAPLNFPESVPRTTCSPVLAGLNRRVLGSIHLIFLPWYSHLPRTLLCQVGKVMVTYLGKQLSLFGRFFSLAFDQCKELLRI